MTCIFKLAVCWLLVAVGCRLLYQVFPVRNGKATIVETTLKRCRIDQIRIETMSNRLRFHRTFLTGALQAARRGSAQRLGPRSGLVKFGLAPPAEMFWLRAYKRRTAIPSSHLRFARRRSRFAAPRRNTPLYNLVSLASE